MWQNRPGSNPPPAVFVTGLVLMSLGIGQVGLALEEPPMNPHSDLIFRATGASSCRDCHRTARDGRLQAQVMENSLVSQLRGKAKGIHGPGRFADCMRCHAGGDKGVEKYRGLRPSE